MSDSLSSYLTQQEALESQRRSSIETKCFATITSVLAVSTLYLALSTKADLPIHLGGSGPRSFLLVALIAAVIALVFALIGTKPAAYSAIETADLEEKRSRVASNDLSDDALGDELAEARIRDLDVARNINTGRAKHLFIAQVSFGVQTAALIASITWASL